MRNMPRTDEALENLIAEWARVDLDLGQRPATAEDYLHTDDRLVNACLGLVGAIALDMRAARERLRKDDA